MSLTFTRYVAAKDTGWSDADKRNEMKEDEPRYLIAREKHSSDNQSEGNEGRPVGFCHFQFTLEDDCDGSDSEDTPLEANDRLEDRKRSRESGDRETDESELKKLKTDQHNNPVEQIHTDVESTDAEDNPNDDDGEYEDIDDEEKKIAVIYCYELQLEPSVRGIGLGSYLMKLAESVGLEWGMRKVVLTVFKSNVEAMDLRQASTSLRDEHSEYLMR
ncbi:hypothetical protein HDV00_007903 [Rhizophlyctis rosea]|nr:hypothetical protein HDV00_007903 [Rhizophlyctis rosea]